MKGVDTMRDTGLPGRELDPDYKVFLTVKTPCKDNC